MSIKEFIKDIKGRKAFEEIAHHEVMPSLEARYLSPDLPLMPALKARLTEMGAANLYSHQAEGLDLIREGKDVVIMTPTASGKSLIYNAAVVESILKDPEARALYLFPLKGLAQDQLRAFNLLTEGLFLEHVARGKAFNPAMCEIYDGDTADYRRKKIRECPPNVILTNPDMLHLSINAFHRKWELFLRSLRYVIIDEVHTYRGVFGSHVAHVLRRFQRILKGYGASPVFIACSATIANPAGLASMLFEREFEVVFTSGSPRGERNFLFINPAPGLNPYTVASRLFTESVKRGFKTIAFTKARKITELMHSWVNASSPELEGKICSYRAGFLPEERRDIEKRLFSGGLCGVISTSALELGVDIGGLDVCILVGYPGTVSSTRQRSGRAGRSGKESLTVMVGINDALDQHFMRHPEDFFRRPVEAAVLDKDNAPITKAHLACVASEAFLKPDDGFYDVERVKPLLLELEAEGRLRHWKKGDVWYSRRRFPQREVSIRGIGDEYLILDDRERPIGRSDASRVQRELYPGAIYMHMGGRWAVTALDMGEKRAYCKKADNINYYTKPVTIENSEIISTDKTMDLNCAQINLGMLKVTESVTGYIKKELHTNRILDERPLVLPASIFTTSGIWMAIEKNIISSVKAEGYAVDGSLHGLEHAMIASLPLYALCDRMDLGGRSYTLSDELGEPGVFIYDGHEGGIGLVKRGFECMGAWLESTLELMEGCACEVSCPGCTHDPNCGNNNDPLDKRGAILILKRWLGRT